MMGRGLIVAVLALGLGGPAEAQVQSNCLAMAGLEPRVIPAALAETEVRLTYVGHSTFLIESAGGVRIATDFAGSANGIIPDVVTMNRAHSTHYTDAPDPKIAQVLRGWGDEGAPAAHDITVGDVRIRNVTTDIRSGSGMIRMKDGNSIFVFEVGGLCIGHLGHLHHELGAEHVGAIGRLDVVMVPVDGGYTMAQSNMMEVLKDVKARVVIPMHYFGPDTLARFIGNLGEGYSVEYLSEPMTIVSSERLPASPKLLVLPGF